MLKKNKEKGITLIALVVTIIVLLILAAVSIAMLTGENGILNNAKLARENTTKGQLQEELQMAINEIQLEKTMKGEPLTKKDIAEYLGSSKEAIIIDYTDKMIDGECGDYQFIVDENNKVTVGGLLTGAKPDPTITPLDTAEGIESARIQVTATITEGEIASIESMDGLTPTAESGNANKTYTVTKNGEYKFKITGTNGRISIEKITISNIEEIMEAESLLKAIEEINENKEKVKVKVTGVTSDGTPSTETYSLDVIYYDSDLTLGSDSSVGKANCLTLEGTTWKCGRTGDINTNTVVLKVDGNLTIEEEKTLTSINSTDNNGPKGMIIFCNGELTNNGTISMKERGCTATGQNIYVNKNTSGAYTMVGATGGTGGKKGNTNASDLPGAGASGVGLLSSGGAGGGNSADCNTAGTSGTSFCGGYGSNTRLGLKTLGGGLLICYAKTIMNEGILDCRGADYAGPFNGAGGGGRWSMSTIV